MDLIHQIIDAFSNPGGAAGATIMGVLSSYVLTFLKKLIPWLDHQNKWIQRLFVVVTAGLIYLVVTLTGADLPLNLLEWTQGDMTVLLMIFTSFFTHLVRKEKGTDSGG